MKHLIMLVLILTFVKHYENVNQVKYIYPWVYEEKNKKD